MYPKKQHSSKNYPEKGQGLVEYALILMLAGLVVMGIALSFGPQIENVFSRFVSRAPVAPPALLAYTPPPTLTPTNTPNPSACYTLTTTVTPGSSGTISRSPAPNCGSQYKDGTVVTLIASPNSNFLFGSWAGDASGAVSTVNVSMTSNKNVTATFEKICYSLEMIISPANGGTITPSPGPNCGVKYNLNTIVTLTAAPAVGAQFRNWSGDASGTNPTVTVKMTGNKSATASFDQFCYALSATAFPPNGGTATFSPAPNCGSNKYMDGTIVTLFAVPESNFQFISWTGDIVGTNPSTTVTMNGNKSAVANFNSFCYTLTTAVSPVIGGNITKSPAPNCGGTQYSAGTIVTLAAVASSGYQFNNWTGDATGATTPTTVTMNANRSVSGNFSQLCYAVTTAAAPNGGGTINRSPSPNCGANYTWGTQVSFTAVPATGYTFTTWGGNASGSTNPTTLTINSAANVIGNFTNIPPTPPGPALSCTLALGKTAVSSSVESASYPASQAVDGNLSTRWSSLFNDSNWIYIDLGARYDISRVILHWEAAYGKNYEVQVSDDTNNWTTIKTITNGDGGTDDMTGLTGQGQYVRMNGIQRGTQWGYSLYEFEICGTPLIASETFESSNWSGGTGWTGDWTDRTKASITDSNSPYAGTYHLQLQKAGSLQRRVNLSGKSAVTLAFYWKIVANNNNDQLVVEISNNGTNWEPLATLTTRNQDYAQKTVTIPATYFTNTARLRIRSTGNANSDYFYIDNITISGN